MDDNLPRQFNPPPKEPVDMSTVPAQAALEIADGAHSPLDVLTRHGFAPDQIEWLMQHAPFLMQIERYRADLQKNGYTFRSKAGYLAEEHLVTAHDIINDVDTPANVRTDTIKWLAKMGGLEPKEGPMGIREGVSITINLDSKAEPLIIESNHEQIERNS